MKYFKLLLVLGLCGGTFLYGFMVRHKEMPPFEQLRTLSYIVNPKPAPKMAEFDLNEAAIAASLAEISVDVEATRADLKARVILPEEMVSLSRLSFNEGGYFGEDEIIAKMYGITNTSVLIKATAASTCLRVYVQGHGGNPFDFDYHNALRETAVQEGCDVLSMSMLGLGLNRGVVEFPSGTHFGQSTRLDWHEVSRHGNFMFYRDAAYPDHDYMSLFMTPHYYTIRSVIDNYETASVMGISGGGWYAVFLAALIPEFDYSIVYAGSLPNVYRTSSAFFADYEEVASDIYREYDYWALYQLGSHRAAEYGPRVQYFVFNDRDPCCFMDPAASHFADVAERLYGDAVDVTIDENSLHAIKPEVVTAIWQKEAEKRPEAPVLGDACLVAGALECDQPGGL